MRRIFAFGPSSSPINSFSMFYYYYYYYYSLIRTFRISISRWFFTGVWVTASLLKSPGLFSVFWPFSIMLSFGWSPPIHQLLCPPVPAIRRDYVSLLKFPFLSHVQIIIIIIILLFVSVSHQFKLVIFHWMTASLQDSF